MEYTNEQLIEATYIYRLGLKEYVREYCEGAELALKDTGYLGCSDRDTLEIFEVYVPHPLAGDFTFQCRIRLHTILDNGNVGYMIETTPNLHGLEEQDLIDIVLNLLNTKYHDYRGTKYNEENGLSVWIKSPVVYDRDADDEWDPETFVNVFDDLIQFDQDLIGIVSEKWAQHIDDES
jgi:hypothetical protein